MAKTKIVYFEIDRDEKGNYRQGRIHIEVIKHGGIEAGIKMSLQFESKILWEATTNFFDTTKIEIDNPE